MLLALFSDFWTVPWPVPTPAPTPTPSPTNAGSGQMREYPQEKAWPDRARDDYWEAREQFLARHMPVVPTPEVEKVPEVVHAVARHNDLREQVRIRQIEDIELPAIGKMMDELAALVAKFEQDAEDEAIEILLLI